MKKVISLAAVLTLICSGAVFYANAETGEGLSAPDGAAYDFELTEDMLSDRVPIYSEDASVLAVNGWTMGQTSDFKFTDDAWSNNSTTSQIDIYANVGGEHIQLGVAFCVYKDYPLIDTVRGGFLAPTDHYCHASTGGTNSELSQVAKAGIKTYTNAISYYSEDPVTVKGFAYVGYGS